MFRNTATYCENKVSSLQEKFQEKQFMYILQNEKKFIDKFNPTLNIAKLHKHTHTHTTPHSTQEKKGNDNN